MMAGRTMPDRAQERGFTLLEVMVGLVVLAMAATAVVQGVAISSTAVRQGEDATLALEAVRSLRERIEATPMADVVATWGEGGTEGPTFTVERLDGVVSARGRVVLVRNENDTDPALRKAFGLPQDLDGDGLTETADISGTARILPVLIEVTWGRGANHRLAMPAIVTR